MIPLLKGLKIIGKRFAGDKLRIEKCSKELMTIANDRYRDTLEKQNADI